MQYLFIQYLWNRDIIDDIFEIAVLHSFLHSSVEYCHYLFFLLQFVSYYSFSLHICTIYQIIRLNVNSFLALCVHLSQSVSVHASQSVFNVLQFIVCILIFPLLTLYPPCLFSLLFTLSCYVAMQYYIQVRVVEVGVHVTSAKKKGTWPEIAPMEIHQVCFPSYNVDLWGIPHFIHCGNPQSFHTCTCKWYFIFLVECYILQSLFSVTSVCKVVLCLLVYQRYA